MKKILRLLVSGLIFNILAACGNSSTTQSVSVVNVSKTSVGSSLPTAVDAYSPSGNSEATTQSTNMKMRVLGNAPMATVINLSAPMEAQLRSASANDYAAGKPLQIGFARQVAQTTSSSATKQILNWETSASGGKVAAISISSTTAKGLRIGLVVNKLPAKAVLRFYAKNSSTAFEFSGAEVLALLARNAAAGDATDAGKTFWGPRVDGTESTIEIELPPSVGVDAVDVSIPSISHMFMSFSKAGDIVAQTAYSGPNFGLVCEIDVTCTAPLPAASNAVTLLDYLSNGSEYICSGTLLNDSINSSTPYVLSANHCISDQTTASTLYTWWFYRSNTCNATNGNFTLGTLGATLLYTAYNTDSTLLRLSSAPPAGVLFAGWDATVAPALATPVTNIHHPEGDAQRISSGSVTGYFTRSPTASTTFSPSTIASSTILEVTLTSGLTERGSSGSGLFKGTNTNPQLIGQLFGGPPIPNCSNSAVANVFGRFDVAFNAGMSDWLLQDLKPVYRFYNNLRGTHFFSQSVSEKNFILANYPQFSFENAAFSAYSYADAVTRSPVYRFYNSQTQSHFFTIDAAEKDGIVAKIDAGVWPQFAYEGTSWYAKTAAQFTASPSGTIPLYRFYRTNGTHFYTVNAAEKASIIANLSAYYTYEGIAYYVWPN